MSSLPCIAIAGGTGKLGQHIVTALNDPDSRSKFSSIIVLSRTSPTDLPKGVETRTVSSESIDLSGVNIVVNVLSSSAGPQKEALIRAIAQTPSAHLYFPSEYGVDHTLGTSSEGSPAQDFDHPEWNKKKSHSKLARKLFSESGREVKICHVFPDLFLEHSVGKWFGLDVPAGRFEAVGSADEKSTYTAMADIGKTVAALASLPLNKIPEYVRVSGDEVTIREIADLMNEASGGKSSIEIAVIDEQPYKVEVFQEEKSGGPARYLRFLIGNGKLNYGKDGSGNLNELVNPGGKAWKWKTMKDHAEETKGKPWCD